MDNLKKIHTKNYNINYNILYCLTKFRGIGFNLATYILYKLNIDKTKKVKDLSDDEISKLDSILLQNIVNLEIPEYFITDHNEGLCTIDSNLKIIKERNIFFKKSIKNYEGIRHIVGQKVRGQKTKSTGRINKKMRGFKAKLKNKK